MKVGVFVGSFDPVHNGHVKLINYLVDKKIVDKMRVIPTGNYWDKQNLSSIKHRLNMLNLIKSEDIIIDDRHNDINYTYEISDFIAKTSELTLCWNIFSFIDHCHRNPLT